MSGKKKGNKSVLLLLLLVVAVAGLGLYRYGPEYLDLNLGSKKSDPNAFYTMALKAQEKGNDPQAIEYYEKFLTAQAQTPGSKNPHIAHANVNIGKIYLKELKYKKAMPYLVKAADFASANLEPNSTDAADTFYVVAAAYDQQGEVQPALDYYKKYRTIQDGLGQDTSKVDKDIEGLENYIMAAKHEKVGS
ncbi:MAG: tetratricopeptide repeat protein [Nitrospinaceae bacterium]|nr:tetratricopeptide repeat protein [Nitrospinaceae bacterium]NIR56788.1 tetratricopeptide repeat protein [Nitrospinaceae bacterium]NIS87244.1 tetratricopeptide repeat protein [Nitrospinaceae bacterium]NIT82398.1 tetratricopeptide repeat protein [Nitrospinaceae bacterium]NIU44611.1 tetratricopeptide repeat protein [Nitrospinaceae bacterium]